MCSCLRFIKRSTFSMHVRLNIVNTPYLISPDPLQPCEIFDENVGMSQRNMSFYDTATCLRNF